uniref:Uncharacterized protein n=1 Tax=Cannabis sativa TaxID=3483 RepID=A0A803R7Z6_CANSA
MENSMGVGFMEVFVVTGSVVLLAHQIHKRVLSVFMKDIEFELGLTKRRFGIGMCIFFNILKNTLFLFVPKIVFFFF